jgi:hypothetical protein
MTVKPLSDELRAYLRAQGIETQYDNKVRFLEQVGTSHRSLRFKVVEETRRFKDPARHYEFSVNMHYRAYCFKPEPNVFEVFDIDTHNRV